MILNNGTMECDVRQRIKEMLSQNGISINALSNGDNALQRKLQRQINEGAALSYEVLRYIQSVFPEVSAEWLLTGEGAMLKDTDTDNRGTVDVMPADAAPKKGVIPFFDREIACGPACDYNASIEASKADGTISLPNIEGDFALIARGDSMIDPEHPDKSIPSGSLVVLKKATDDILRWGEVYALATTDGFLIKKVMPTDDSERIELRSLNASEFPPFCVRKKDVYGVARVVAVVNYRLY